jgi:peptidoglycan/xylan/chitin deacetylase (PgdA/CDA1 family)
VCSISVDVDPIGCYYEIHGLDAPPEHVRTVIMRRAVPRFVELFRRHRVPATFFLVGRCLDDEVGRATAAELAAESFELGNHSQTHPYDLARLPPELIVREIAEAHDSIVAAAGRAAAPVGFRAPGYEVSPALAGALVQLGYRYDSSILPSPAYYLAKLAVLGLMSSRGERSHSVVGDPRVLLARAQPYRPDPQMPWRRGQASFVELPIAVTPGFRLPVIGTALVLAPGPLRARLLESMRAHAFFNLELHGIDLIDADGDGIPGELCARQPDLRRPLRDKLRALEATIDRLRHEYEFAPLRNVAADVQREA